MTCSGCENAGGGNMAIEGDGGLETRAYGEDWPKTNREYRLGKDRLHLDGLFPSGAGGDDLDPATHQFFDPFDVGQGVLR